MKGFIKHKKLSLDRKLFLTALTALPSSLLAAAGLTGSGEDPSGCENTVKKNHCGLFCTGTEQMRTEENVT